MPDCNNCHHTIEGNYCSHCGQKASVARLGLHEIFHDVVHAITHAEKGFFRVAKELLFTPGKLYSNYFSGKRKTYFSPVTFFLLLMGLALIAGDRLIRYDRQMHGIDPANIRHDAERVLFSFQKIRYLLFIPLISLLTWLFFYRRFNLAECLAFWFFCLGMVVMVELLSYGIQFLFIYQRHTIHYFTDWLVFAMLLWHLFAVFARGNRKSIAGSVILGLASYFLLVYIYKFLAHLQGYNTDFNFVHIIRSVFS